MSKQGNGRGVAEESQRRPRFSPDFLVAFDLVRLAVTNPVVNTAEEGFNVPPDLTGVIIQHLDDIVSLLEAALAITRTKVFMLHSDTLKRDTLICLPWEVTDKQLREKLAADDGGRYGWKLVIEISVGRAVA